MNNKFDYSKLETKLLILFFSFLSIFLFYFLGQSVSVYSKIIILSTSVTLILFLKFNKYKNWVFLVSLFLYIGFLIFRSPEIMLEGRFFAEEGSIYWSYSLLNSKSNTFLYTPVIAGYYLLIANLQILLSSFVPIYYAPLVTVWVSMIISLLPSILFFLLTEKSLDNNRRILSSILLLVLPSLNFLEVFANSINSQTYLGLSVFVIYIFGLNNDSKKIKFLEYFILVLGSLSAYYSLILFPVLFFRYLKIKTIKIIFPLIIWIFGVFIQLNVIFYTFMQSAFYGDKFKFKINLDYFILILKKSISVNLFTEHFLNNSIILNISLLLFIIFLIFLISSKNAEKFLYFLILLSFVLEIFLVIVGQASQGYSGRYAVVPSTVIFFIFIVYFSKARRGEVVLIFAITIGILNFSFQSGDYFIDCKNYCISWAEQIENYENEQKIIIHWPLGDGDPFWYTNLSSPKPNPSDFQKKVIGKENISKFYNLTLADILKFNFIK